MPDRRAGLVRNRNESSGGAERPEPTGWRYAEARCEPKTIDQRDSHVNSETARLHTAIRTALFFALDYCILYAEINSERVSRKRSLRLCARLSDALKLFNVKVTEQEEASESEVIGKPKHYVMNLDKVRAESLYETLNDLMSEGYSAHIDDVVKHLSAKPKTEPPKE